MTVKTTTRLGVAAMGTVALLVFGDYAEARTPASRPAASYSVAENANSREDDAAAHAGADGMPRTASGRNGQAREDATQDGASGCSGSAASRDGYPNEALKPMAAQITAMLRRQYCGR